MKIGDKVRVKDYTFISEEMSKYNGKELEIVERDGLRGFVLKLDDKNFIKLNEETLEKICEYQPKHAKEMVNHPDHYNQGKYECIDEMIALFGVERVIGFCMCNIYKYKTRASHKNGEEDMRKADWYMDKLLELQAISTMERE